MILRTESYVFACTIFYYSVNRWWAFFRIGMNLSEFSPVREEMIYSVYFLENLTNKIAQRVALRLEGWSFEGWTSGFELEVLLSYQGRWEGTTFTPRLVGLLASENSISYHFVYMVNTHQKFSVLTQAQLWTWLKSICVVDSTRNWSETASGQVTCLW